MSAFHPLLDDDDPRYPDDDRRGSVLTQLFRLPDEEPEDCWRFIQIACELPLSDDQLGLLGAGVFEDLMDAHGSEVPPTMRRDNRRAD